MAQKVISDEAGLTIIEVVVVLVISAVLISAAVVNFDSGKRDLQVQNVAKELSTFLARARYDSVKRRPENDAAMSRVVVKGATSFTVTLDFNNNGILEPSETRLIDFGNRSRIRILGDGVTLPIDISFDRHGHVNAFDAMGKLVNPSFIVCENCENVSSSVAEGYRIRVSSSGTVAMKPTSVGIITFTPPGVSSVAVGKDVNGLVVSAGSPPYVPTPTPTGTPVAPVDPIQFPPLSATPTPTPTPSPTPTPTPKLCARNESPSHTGCVCKAPLAVQKNGQCK